MSPTAAVPANVSQPASSSVRPARARELAALAYALPHALTADRERPARWLSTPFVISVEQTRQRLAPIRDVDVLADAFEGVATPDPQSASSFATAVSQLARDPHRIALAIRRLEITESTSLASWPELVRGGLPRGSESRSGHDASLWFG